MSPNAARVEALLRHLQSRMFKVALVCIADARLAHEIALELTETLSVEVVDVIDDILPSIRPGRDGKEEVMDLVEKRARSTDKPLFFRDFDALLAVLPGGKPEALQLLSDMDRARPVRTVALALRCRDLVPAGFSEERVLQL